MVAEGQHSDAALSSPLGKHKMSLLILQLHQGKAEK